MKYILVFRIVIIALALSIICCNDKPDLRHPLAAEQSFQFADPELQISLIASEPDINSPVDMAWSPDGSLYVVEMTGYPVTAGKGKIKKLTDPDGDGRYTLASVFADSLDFPVSAMYYRGGLLVADAPHIYFLRDSNGDGKADEKKIFLTGFFTGNQQYRANSLQWGLDNWIYGANGRASGAIGFANDTKRVAIEGRDFRINPVSLEIEAVSGLSQFGLALDNWGNRFISYNHRFARQVMLEEEHLLRNPALNTSAIYDTSKSEHDRRVWTRLSDLMRFNKDPIGYFTSLSGITAYRGNLLGPAYAGTLFAGESVQAAIIARRLQKEGPIFTAHDMEEDAEFLSSTDDWFHPVNFSNGPDGALYTVDFYRKFVEHPEWANDEKEDGIDWNTGEQHGRIWRIARRGNKIDPNRMRPALDVASIEEIVSQFMEEAGWRRDMAQQILVEGQKKEAVPFIERILDTNIVLAKNHAYWTLEGLGAITTDHIARALEDDNSEIIIQGIKLAARQTSLANTLKEKLITLLTDQNSAIRYHAILALGDEKDPSVQDGIIAAVRMYPDKWTRVATLSSAAQWPLYLAQRMLSEDITRQQCDASMEFYRQIGDMLSYVGDKKTNEWVKTVIDDHSKDNCNNWAMVVGYTNGMKHLNKPLPKLNTKIFEYALENIQHSTDNLIALLGIELLQHATTEKARNQFLDLMLNSNKVAVQVAGVEMFSNLERGDYLDQLYNNINAMSLAIRAALINSAKKSKKASLGLLNAIEKEIISTEEIPEEIRYAMLYNDHPIVKEKADLLLSYSVIKDRDGLVKKYLDAIQDIPADPKAGALTFAVNCTSCHSIKGSGGNLGPDLTNIGSRSNEVLLTSILDPGRMVSYELKLHVVTTKSGRVYTGTVAAETTSSITIRQSNGIEQTILIDNIKDNLEIDQSIMPEGYERIIDEKAMANLLAYLHKP